MLLKTFVGACTVVPGESGQIKDSRCDDVAELVSSASSIAICSISGSIISHALARNGKWGCILIDTAGGSRVRSERGDRVTESITKEFYHMVSLITGSL